MLQRTIGINVGSTSGSCTGWSCYLKRVTAVLANTTLRRFAKKILLQQIQSAAGKSLYHNWVCWNSSFVLAKTTFKRFANIKCCFYSALCSFIGVQQCGNMWPPHFSCVSSARVTSRESVATATLKTSQYA